MISICCRSTLTAFVVALILLSLLFHVRDCQFIILQAPMAREDEKIREWITGGRIATEQSEANKKKPLVMYFVHLKSNTDCHTHTHTHTHTLTHTHTHTHTLTHTHTHTHTHSHTHTHTLKKHRYEINKNTTFLNFRQSLRSCLLV